LRDTFSDAPLRVRSSQHGLDRADVLCGALLRSLQCRNQRLYSRVITSRCGCVNGNLNLRGALRGQSVGKEVSDIGRRIDRALKPANDGLPASAKRSANGCAKADLLRLFRGEVAATYYRVQSASECALPRANSSGAANLRKSGCATLDEAAADAANGESYGSLSKESPNACRRGIAKPTLKKRGLVSHLRVIGGDFLRADSADKTASAKPQLLSSLPDLGHASTDAYQAFFSPVHSVAHLLERGSGRGLTDNLRLTDSGD
jgi:hypothetical protein